MFAWIRRKMRRLKMRFVPKPKPLEETNKELADLLIAQCQAHRAALPSKPRIVMSRRDAKLGRNAPCPCGSGKKFKKCCGAIKNKGEGNE